MIRKSSGEVVKSFIGYQSPPETLEWDGRNANNKMADPGEYTYRMSLTDSKNVTEMTPARSLRIVGPTPFEIEMK